VTDGMDVVKAIEHQGGVWGKTRAPCVIYDCGELPPPVRDYS
jgi:hypothetical protein